MSMSATVPLILATAGLCLLLGAAAAVAFLRWRLGHWRRRGVAGPRPHLLRGTFPRTSAGECNLVEELHELYLAHKAAHQVIGVFAAHSPKLFVLDPRVAADVLTQNFSCFRDNESSKWTTAAAEKLRPCSPFVSTGEDWRKRRAELTPALTSIRLRASHPALRRCAARLVAHLETRQAPDLVDAKEVANRFTAQFMAAFIWGLEVDAFAAETDVAACPLLPHARAMIAQALACVRHYGRTAAWPWLRRLAPVRFFPPAADRFFLGLAATATAAASSAPRGTVLDHLLQLRAKRPLGAELVAGHTTTVLIDGFETGAILIAHCLLLLGRDQRVQQKLRSELRALDSDAGDSDPDPDPDSDSDSLEALLGLPYLDQCVHETLRLFPPLPTLFKLCTAPTTLGTDGGRTLRLRPDDVVYISSYSFHRDAEFFESPERFWPERFAAELGGVRRYRESGAFLPFGDGPRQCPGLRLGLAEAKAAVAAVVRRFRIECGPRTRRDNRVAPDSFLLTLAGEIELSFRQINTT